jgi:hypothetical protein
MIPNLYAISFIAVLNKTALSAASVISEYVIAASYVPGPVSVCNPSRGTLNFFSCSNNSVKK